MAMDGLASRLFGEYLSPGESWQSIAVAVGLDPSKFAWPLIALGTAWSGAVSGYWLKFSWGKWAVASLGALSFLFLGFRSLLAFLILAVLWISARLASREVQDG
jgi:hypothetical protein